jgi:hypothetical protein
MASVLVVGRSQRHGSFLTALDAGLHHTCCHASVTTAVRSLAKDVPDIVILAETVHPLAQSFFVRRVREMTPDVKVIAISPSRTEEECSEILDACFDIREDCATLLATVDAVLLSAAPDAEY